MLVSASQPHNPWPPDSVASASSFWPQTLIAFSYRTWYPELSEYAVVKEYSFLLLHSH